MYIYTCNITLYTGSSSSRLKCSVNACQWQWCGWDRAYQNAVVDRGGGWTGNLVPLLSQFLHRSMQRLTLTGYFLHITSSWSNTLTELTDNLWIYHLQLQYYYNNWTALLIVPTAVSCVERPFWPIPALFYLPHSPAARISARGYQKYPHCTLCIAIILWQYVYKWNQCMNEWGCFPVGEVDARAETRNAAERQARRPVVSAQSADHNSFYIFTPPVSTAGLLRLK